LVYSIDDFVAILSTRPGGFALVSWEHRPAMLALLDNLKPVLRRTDRKLRVALLNGENMSSEQFEDALQERLQQRNTDATILVLCNLETLLEAAGRVLNGVREQMRRFRAVILVVRENRRADLLAACPDFVDWFGITTYRAEALARPFTSSDVQRAIRSYEKKHSMSSRDFAGEWEAGRVTNMDDGWMWNELLALYRDLTSAEEP
jgi:hypothetical protein